MMRQLSKCTSLLCRVASVNKFQRPLDELRKQLNVDTCNILKLNFQVQFRNLNRRMNTVKRVLSMCM